VVCEEFRCLSPISDPEVLKKSIGSSARSSASQ
jgi:hypothetical protein